MGVGAVAGVAGIALFFGATAALASGVNDVKVNGIGYALSATGGVVAFGLPTGTTGVQAAGSGSFSSKAPSINAVGYQDSISASLDLGHYGGTDFSLGFVGFGAYAAGSSMATDSFTGSGTIIVPGYTTPPGTINLTTAGTPVTSSVTAPGLTGTNTASASVGSCCQDVFGAKQNFPGQTFSLAEASAGATNGSAYGAVASGAGGIFAGTGNLTGLTVTTTEAEALTFAGADLTLAASGDIGGNRILQAYVGPSYRYLGQHVTNTTTVSMPALSNGSSTPPPSPISLPTYTDQQIEDINSNYFGATGGLNITTPIAPNTLLTLGGDVGLYNASTQLTGNESFTLRGGFGSAGGALPVPTQTVDNQNTQSLTANSIAYSAGLNSAVTISITNALAISFGGSLEYLSGVPVANHATPTLVSAAGGELSYSSPGVGAAPLISYAGMWNYGGTISLTGHF